MRDDNIAVNYRNLPDRLKNLEDPNDIKSKQQDLMNEISKQEANISRLPAPNLKAQSRYVKIYVHFMFFDFLVNIFIILVKKEKKENIFISLAEE